MAKPVLAALEHLMADGRYMKILDKWGVQAGAITDPAINGAVS
jgi:polar amino acid transport system substrate-binding protein